MFDKILIANRGEIACRIARTCRGLGIRTVAVYSEADADAAHLAACDEAWLLGPAPARESYLNTERILDVARRSGAQAIHPGYGFLSENPDFARACEAAGIAFIGPPAAAIEAMGSKRRAKALLAEAGVPLVPGYHGDDQSEAALLSAAEETGYPLLIKASAGGGGKGMRRVDRAEEFASALAAAKREAASAFGDDSVLLERYLLEPRHIEIQVFADSHGKVVHLHERDCSVQRRHQKVLEEAPAPGLTPALREAMGAAAVRAASAIGYVGAGTVEFIAEPDGRFYFMEMNTRLQVEHPVTEMITGLDLVEWQLRVAAGEQLPRAQNEIPLHGHAFEARLYAEDPHKDFLPSSGRILHLRLPEPELGLRIDAGVRAGEQVSVHYDPMLAKLIVHGPDRSAALQRLRRALDALQIVGPATNLSFLRRLAAHPAFAAGGVSTDFIERYRDALIPARQPVSARMIALAALAELLRLREIAARQAAVSGDPYSPWHAADGWRLNATGSHSLGFRDGDEDFEVSVGFQDDTYLLDLPEGQLQVSGSMGRDGSLHAVLGDQQLRATVVRDRDHLTVLCAAEACTLELRDPYGAGLEHGPDSGSLTAPMPGTVIAVHVSEGEHVSEAQPLLVLEAMKMEYTIRAPMNGVVEAVHYRAGDQVAEGVELLKVEAEAL
mgnify:FL=1